MTIDEKAKEILKHRGEKNQILKMMEEMAELEVALHHVLGGRGSISDVREELADVCLVAKQLQIIFNLTDDRLEERMHGKADRELGRIGVAEPKGSGWIDIKKETPERNGVYLVTVLDMDGELDVIDAVWRSNISTWVDAENFAYVSGRKWRDDKGGTYKLTAWMPLPEPYEGGAE